MKKSHNGDILAMLTELVESDPTALVERKVDALRISLALALREARERSGKTQREIAKALGVRQPWVSKLESCNNDHTFESLAKYAFALGADITLSMTFDGVTPVEMASSRGRSDNRAKKYKVDRLPGFIRFVDDSTADHARRENWNLNSAGLESQPQLGFYVA